MLHIVIALIKLLLFPENKSKPKNRTDSAIFHRKEIIRNFAGMLKQLEREKHDYEATVEHIHYAKMMAKKLREEFVHYPSKVEAIDQITTNLDHWNFNWKEVQKHLKVIKKGY